MKRVQIYLTEEQIKELDKEVDRRRKRGLEVNRSSIIRSGITRELLRGK